MMGIPDGRPSGLFGFHSLQQARDYDKWDYNSAGTLTGHTHLTTAFNMLQSNRTGKSSNRRLPIGSTSSLWINPSSYSRSVWRVETLQGGQYELRRSNGSLQSREWETIALSALWYQNRNSMKGFWPSGQNTEAVNDDNTRSRLITECLLNLKDQKVNLGENLATAKQTYDLFAKNSVTLFKSLRAAKRGDWKGAFGELGLKPRGRPIGLGLSQRYLEYIYGIKPLMGDIYGAYELLNEQLKPACLVYARRVLRDTQRTSYQKTDISRNYELQFDCWARRRDKIQLVGRVSDNYARDVARAGISNPGSLAWDLLPWSFAVDWATPIGSVLSAMDATYGLTFVGGYISRVVEGTETCTTLRRPYNGWKQIQPLIMTALKFDNTRERLSTWPRPQFYAKSPFSTSHAVTALALARQLF